MGLPPARSVILNLAKSPEMYKLDVRRNEGGETYLIVINQ